MQVGYPICFQVGGQKSTNEKYTLNIAKKGVRVMRPGFTILSLKRHHLDFPSISFRLKAATDCPVPIDVQNSVEKLTLPD